LLEGLCGTAAAIDGDRSIDGVIDLPAFKEGRAMRTLLRRTVLVGLTVFILVCFQIVYSAQGQSKNRQSFLPFVNKSSQAAGILWQADFETGDLTQVSADAGGTISISGQGDNKIATSPTHSGQYSVALTVYNADGINEHPGVRLTRWGILGTPKQLPDSAYYSAWYYLPTYVKPDPYWNVYQWKQRRQNPDGTRPTDPTYTINLDDQADGTLKYRLQAKVEPDGSYLASGRRVAVAAGAVPLNRWIHLECLYVWSRTTTGRVTCWQDGVQIWDIQDVQTEFSDALHPDSIAPKRSWTVNNYVDKSDPQTHTLYVDDMVISSVQAYPGP
jgi:hypothetical protein